MQGCLAPTPYTSLRIQTDLLLSLPARTINKTGLNYFSCSTVSIGVALAMQFSFKTTKKLRPVLFDARAGNSNLAKSLIEYDLSFTATD